MYTASEYMEREREKHVQKFKNTYPEKTQKNGNETADYLENKKITNVSTFSRSQTLKGDKNTKQMIP